MKARVQLLCLIYIIYYMLYELVSLQIIRPLMLNGQKLSFSSPLSSKKNGLREQYNHQKSFLSKKNSVYIFFSFEIF